MIEYDKVKVGKFLKETRESANLTQAEVSSLLGYSSSQFISNIERGASVAPLIAMAKMMKIYKSNPDPLVKIIMESQTAILRKKLSARN